MTKNAVDINLLNEFHSKEDYEITTAFTSPECTEDEVDLIIKNLKSSNATDIYGMSNNFVKLHKSQLIKTLTKLINENISRGSFPD